LKEEKRWTIIEGGEDVDDSRLLKEEKMWTIHDY